MEERTTRVVVLIGLDYVSFAIPQLKKQFAEVLCVVDGVSPVSTAEVAKESAIHDGVSVIVSNDVSIVGAVVSKFSPSVGLDIHGSDALKRVISESLGDADSLWSMNLSYDESLEKSGLAKDLASKPSWPEFDAIWQGCATSRIVLFRGSQKVKDIHVEVSEQDTAISLRYKQVRSVEQAKILETIEMTDRVSSSDLQNANNNFNEKKSSDSVFVLATSSSSDIIYMDPTAVTDTQADRLIRGMTFPPYDPAVLLSEIDGCEYFVETLDQYLGYKAQLGETSSKEATTVVSIGQSNLIQKYSADTHWYSNVGGSIVKVEAANYRKMRRKEESVGIPGQAVGTNKKKLRMNEPLIGLTAMNYVSQALTSGWIGVEGPYIKKFEQHLARICGVIAACAVQSGTAALYGAMKALGVSDPLHHVIVPTYTCAACADAIVHAGGVPIAVDCELSSYGLDFSAVKLAVDSDPNVVGIVIAPCYGVPSRDHLLIRDLCEEHGIWLCEDNCETYGAHMASVEIDGKTSTANDAGVIVPVGSLSTMSVVSVRSEKMVGVGEGGAILSKDPALVSKARWWCSRAPVRGCGLWRVYEHENVGQNFRLPELLGAVGVAACENLPVMIEKKRRIHEWYMENLKDVSYLKFQETRPTDAPVWWLNSIKIMRPNDTGLENMAEAVGMEIMKNHPNVEIRPAFYPLHKMSSFEKHAQPCPNSEQIYDSMFCVPSSALLTETDVMEVCAAVKESLLSVVGTL